MALLMLVASGTTERRCQTFKLERQTAASQLADERSCDDKREVKL
jgi:hypothetical protein